MFMDSRPAIRAGLFSVTLLIVTLPISNIARAFERKSRPKFPRPYCRGPVAPGHGPAHEGTAAWVPASDADVTASTIGS